MKLDNNIYDNNIVFDTNEKEIFNGNFKELKEFMLNTFNFKLTDNEDMEAYEDFNGHEFKIQMGIHIDQEFLNQLEATARAEAKLEEIYNKVFGKFSIKEMLEMIKSKEILNYMNQYMNEIPTSFENPHEANYFIFETVDDFIEEMLAQLYYKYKETGIMISFCPDTNINFDEFMFTTDLFAIQEDNEDYIFERISGQGETFYHIYNIKDGKLSANIWRETIEYSKALNTLNEKYKERINETELKLEKVNGKYKPINFDWFLSPEEITNKNIMEPKYGGTWVDNKFIENKEYKYFITEFAALVDSL